VIEGRFGPVIVRVTAIEPAVITPFEEVRDTLKSEIATERAVAEINDLHDAIEDSRAGGDTLSEAAAKYSLKLSTVAAVDATGKGEDGNTVEGLSPVLVKAAFDSDVGLENNPVQPDRTSFTWFEVTSVIDPRDRALDEVRDRVVAAWKEEERARLLRERADAIAKEVNEKGDLAAVAAAHGLEVKKAPKITRVSPPTGDLSSAAIAAAFETERGKAAAAAAVQPMTSLVLVVDAVTVPPYVADAPELAQLKAQFDSQFINDLVGMYVAQLQAKAEVRFNQPVIQQLLGVSPN
jgi:peptidyl-prolyl cis-trans isomerase D